MFTRVKQGLLGNELGLKLGLRAHVDLASVNASVDHHWPLDLTHSQLCSIGQYFDHYRPVGAVVVIHGQMG